MPNVYWSGKLERCQTCHKSFGKAPFGKPTMFDCRVPAYRQWACICEPCFNKYACEIGLGRGQRYDLQLDNRWMKTAG